MNSQIAQYESIVALFPALSAMFVADYEKWTGAMKYDMSYPCNQYLVEFHVGSKYTKIVKVGHEQRSVLGFICMTDVTTKQGSFKAGELLKAAGWKAPALNFARGSIFDLPGCSGSICWTGLQ